MCLKMNKKEEHRLRSKQLLNSRLKKLEFEFLSEKWTLSVKLAKLKVKETDAQYWCNYKHCVEYSILSGRKVKVTDFEKDRRFACIVEHVKTLV